MHLRGIIDYHYFCHCWTWMGRKGLLESLTCRHPVLGMLYQPKMSAFDVLETLNNQLSFWFVYSSDKSYWFLFRVWSSLNYNSVTSAWWTPFFYPLSTFQSLHLLTCIEVELAPLLVLLLEVSICTFIWETMRVFLPPLFNLLPLNELLNWLLC